MLLLYAVVPAGAAFDPRLPDGPALERVPGRLVDVVVAAQEAAPGTDQAAVVAFGEVVQRLAATTTVLPVRFGTVVGGRDELAQLVASREQEWHERLEAVDGHVEVVVHVRDEQPEPESRAVSSGREYLAVRVEAHRREEALAGGVGTALASLARETRRLRAEQGVRVAALVPAARVDDVETRLAGWASDRPGTHVTLTGPWPPFSFAGKG